MKNNYKSISTLKLFLAFAMVLGHCVIYGSIFWPSGDIIGSTFFSFQLRSFSIAVVGCIPALAGYLYYYQRSDNVKLNLINSASIFIFLFIIEGVKSVLISYRFISFFHFDVLVLIGLSLFVIDSLKYFHRYLPSVLAIILLFINPFFELYRGKYVFYDMRKYFSYFNEISWICFFLFNTVIIFFGSYRFYKTKKMFLVFISLLSAIISYKMFFLELKNPKLLYDFFNYPLGALIGIHHASHVWPFFVWFPLIVFGFELGNILKYFKKNLILHAVLISFCLYYIYFYHTQIFENNFFQKMNKGGLGNESVFFVNTLRILLHVSILPLLVYFISLIERIWKLSRFKISGIASRWILFIYIMSIFFAHKVAPVLSKHFDYYLGFGVLFLCNLIVSFLGAYILDIIFLRIKINIKFEKV